jgi:3-methyladenine DNA glycosylase AlkD
MCLLREKLPREKQHCKAVVLIFMGLNSLKKDLEEKSSPAKAKLLSGFFKTGKGEYGEGDVFIGVIVPDQRAVAKKYVHLSLSDLQKLISSKIHEHRLTALLILIEKYKKNPSERKKIVDFYLANTKHINNWDLVDLSSHKILGDYLLDKDVSVLYKLAKSSNIWERRIAIISTAAFINQKRFEHTLKISEILLKDEHDLMHKAAGWMLREVGKRNLEAELKFLDRNAPDMPRTMLRYAIEKFSEQKKKHYMKK